MQSRGNEHPSQSDPPILPERDRVEPEPSLENHTSPTGRSLLLILSFRTSVTLPIPIFVICVTDSTMSLISNEDSCTCSSFKDAIDPLVQEGRGLVISSCSNRLCNPLPLGTVSAITV